MGKNNSEGLIFLESWQQLGEEKNVPGIDMTS